MLPYDKSVRLLGVFAFLVAFCEALSFYAASQNAVRKANTPSRRTDLS